MYLLVDIIVTFNTAVFANTYCMITYKVNNITIYLTDKILQHPLLDTHDTPLKFCFLYDLKPIFQNHAI